MRKVILGLALTVLGATSLRAQIQHQVVLTVPVAPNGINGRCYGDITSETIDGQPFDISNVEAILSPFTNNCPNRDGGLEASLPPQPYFTFQDWAYILPSASQVMRGALVTTACGTLTTPTSGFFYNAKWTFTGNCFQSVDSFSYTDTHHNASWQGTLTRQFAEYNRCTTRSCALVDVEQSDVMNGTVTVN